MELLRAFPEIYVAAVYHLGLNFQMAYEGTLIDSSKNIMLSHLEKLGEECSRANLQMTAMLIRERIPVLESIEPNTQNLFYEDIHHICDDLERELSLQLFIKISSERRERFDNPMKGWEDLAKRFDQIIRDVEERNKCFALSRYTASMFHAMQVAELGAMELGDYIGVTDPKKGWGATASKLGQLIKAGHVGLPTSLAGKFAFLEQMNREIDSMILAWRHKIDHAANRLAIVPNADFTPDIAEHIIGAVRIFMLRLKEGLPAI